MTRNSERSEQLSKLGHQEILSASCRFTLHDYMAALLHEPARGDNVHGLHEASQCEHHCENPPTLFSLIPQTATQVIHVSSEY